MNRQTQHQLKRHPLIRFIRSIYRLLRVLFKPARSNARLNLRDRHRISNQPQIELTDRYLNVDELSDLSRIVDKPKPELTDKYITVGQLFELVQWQLPIPTDSRAISATKIETIPHDFSLN